MKKIIFTLMLFYCVSEINAQENPKSFYQTMKQMTAELDSTKFKNNILYDRVFPLSNLIEFNQNGRKDTCRVKQFYQAVFELRLAGNEKTMISPEYLEQIQFNLDDQNKIGIAILNMDYTRLKPEVFNSSQPPLRIDSTQTDTKYFEIPNQYPYEHRNAFMISSLRKEILQKQNPTVFNFSEALLERSDNPIKNLYVDFGNGLQNVMLNGVMYQPNISYSFPNQGKYTLKLTGDFQDNSTFETYSSVFVRTVTDELPIYKLRATDNFTPYVVENIVFPNGAFDKHFYDKAEIEYSIYYSTQPARNKIRKPIIIMDGIDYGGADEREIDEIYDVSLKLKDANPERKLGDELRSLGYDVVIVNFPKYIIADYAIRPDPMPGGDDDGPWKMVYNEKSDFISPVRRPSPPGPTDDGTITHKIYREGGADYIQRNAKAIKQLIKAVNDSLQINGSSEKLVVVGPSMGGQVSRWALKELENEGYNHNTRLWVSFDSPHQGANIPISMQYFANWGNEYSSLDKLNRSAAKQMLLLHYSDNYYFRDRYFSELSSLSYPINLRRIALVNGTTNGILNGTPGARVANLFLELAGWPYTDVALADLHFTVDNGINEVFYAQKRADIWSWHSPVINNHNTSPTLGSHDVAPGCYIPLTGSYALSTEFNNIYQDGHYLDGWVHQYVDKFTFMPTKSTLDFQGNTYLNETICNRNLVTTGETPFDAYYAPNTNEEHVELNIANVNWLKQELAGNYTTPNLCSTSSIMNNNSHDIPFKIEYSDGFNVTLSLADEPNKTPINELGINNVVWELTSGDGQILEAFDRNAVISGNTFTGRVTLYNENTSATQSFFWPDPDTCKAIFKTGIDEYKVVDRCNDNEIIDVLPIKELYSAYGYKLGDLPLIDQELKIDLGNSGDIQIIKVVIDGESLTKRIIKD